MAGLKVSITFSPESSRCLVGLAKIRNQSVQELAQRLMQEVLKLERVNVTFSHEISECLVGLAKAEGRSVQELAEKLMEEAIKDEEDMILIERVAERDVPGAETVKSEDVDWDKILSAETIKDEEHKQKYDIVYLKDVIEKDFPNLPPAARSKVKKAIDERLTTDPINLGKLLRGRSEDIEED